jgi:hypothetical protein
LFHTQPTFCWVSWSVVLGVVDDIVVVVLMVKVVVIVDEVDDEMI